MDQKTINMSATEYTPSQTFDKPGFFQKTILRILQSLPLGKLHLTLHTGEKYVIGNGQGNIEAMFTIKNKSFYRKCTMDADIGFAESYIDGDWETDNLTGLISYFLLNGEYAGFISGNKVQQYGYNFLKFINRLIHARRVNTLHGAKKNIAEHYDLGNGFYALWLDRSMTYSSAYFKTPDMTLEEAQYQKYDRLCRILNLQPGDEVLEIGSGWGSNAIHIAKYYDCKVTTITISEAQYHYASQKINEQGLQDKITIKLLDYRKIEGKFDKIVSIEMLEAVGAKYMDTYFKKCHQLLKKEGLLALQVITCPDSRFEQLRKSVDFIQKHIFPGSLVPSISTINESVNKTGELNLVDLKDIGLDYAQTLAIWRNGFNNRLKEIQNMGYSDSFIRKWNYYLCYCEAAFTMRNINVVQMLYSMPNNKSY